MEDKNGDMTWPPMSLQMTGGAPWPKKQGYEHFGVEETIKIPQKKLDPSKSEVDEKPLLFIWIPCLEGLTLWKASTPFPVDLDK